MFFIPKNHTLILVFIDSRTILAFSCGVNLLFTMVFYPLNLIKKCMYPSVLILAGPHQTLSYTIHHSFNPCFSGFVITTYKICPEHTAIHAHFNPCFSGFVITTNEFEEDFLSAFPFQSLF